MDLDVRTETDSFGDMPQNANTYIENRRINRYLRFQQQLDATVKDLLLPFKNVSYDPKTRSTSGDNPVPDTDPKDKFNAGDIQNKTSRGVLELKQHIRKRAVDYPFEKGQDEHMQWGYSKAKILSEKIWAAREMKLKEKCVTIIDENGNEKQIPRKAYLDRFFKSQCDCLDDDLNIMTFEKMVIPRSKYEEDIYNNNHTTVWGSWWNDHQWGYKCCKQIVRNSYCTGTAGFEAADATTHLMKAEIARRRATKDQRMSSAYEAARRAALAPEQVAEEDEKENNPNPHIPKYVPYTPWYRSAEVNPVMPYER